MPKVTKNDLLKVKDEQQLAEALFPEAEGFQYKKERGLHGEIIVIVDDMGTEVHVLGTDERPLKVDQDKFAPEADFKLVFQRGKHLLLLGRDLVLGQVKVRHTRVDWEPDVLTRSFVQTLGKLEFNNYAAFEDLFERKEVTDRFYEDFIKEVEKLAQGIENVATMPDARRIAFTIADRLLFLHFIQNKGLLDRNKSYIRDLVNANGTALYDKIFRRLFFEVLAGEGDGGGGFGEVPALNGGLFRPSPQEEANPDCTVNDEALKRFLDFLSPDTPPHWHWHLDERQDIDEPNTLDPALLGHIFEKTVNQKDAGAYYTPRAIARYMAEQAIWGYLGGRLSPPASARDFETRLEQMAKVDKGALVSFANSHLARLTVLDNACGSGAFLLAALDVLLDTWERIVDLVGRSPQRAKLAATFEMQDGPQIHWKYQLTKWITTRNIYGVDIEPGAVEIAKLRLWLALISHAPDDPTKVEPLPNIDYNLRCGNSLVGFAKWDWNAAKLAILETDCSDLADQAPPAFTKTLRDGWAAGELLQRSLACRRQLIHRFRETRNTREATQLKHAIDAFDDRTRGQIESLWEHRLAESIADARWIASYREQRDEVVRPFHWWYEFPEMFADGGCRVIITNPPWGASVPQSVRTIAEESYHLAKGQYDIWDLFVERSHAILADAGRSFHVLPDSLFKPEHSRTREFLLHRSLTHVVKLGEGWFQDVFIAAGILGTENAKPNSSQQSICGIIKKEQRGQFSARRFRDGLLEVLPQSHFAANPGFEFDIFCTRSDVEILDQMRRATIEWSEVTTTGRGIELAASGEILQCPKCNMWVTKPRVRKGKVGKKTCEYCKGTFEASEANEAKIILSHPPSEDGDFVEFARGEDVRRNEVTPSGYLKLGYSGVNYKASELYQPPKLLVRKTGVGIYSAIDEADTYVNQAVFIWKEKANPHGYSLQLLQGLLCSRLMLYYYYLSTGMIEWQSFPYITQRIVQAFPLPPLSEGRREIAAGIENLVSRAPRNFDSAWELALERLVAGLYGLEDRDLQQVYHRLGAVQELQIIRELFPEGVPHFVDRLGVQEHGVQDAAQLLSKGESARREFKSSARWDYQTQQINKDLQFVIAKTLAGFLNRDGGELFIGVDDGGKVVGIEKDLKSLGKRPDLDGYEQFLTQLVANSLGTDVCGWIELDFPRADGKHVCRLTVKAGPRAVYVKEGGQERFYVRTGNSTRELGVREAVEYIAGRWGTKGSPMD